MFLYTREWFDKLLTSNTIKVRNLRLFGVLLKIYTHRRLLEINNNKKKKNVLVNI